MEFLRESRKIFRQKRPALIKSPYSPDLASCDFWLFPKLIGCRYETIEEMKEAVTKVLDMLTEEEFQRPSRS